MKSRFNISIEDDPIELNMTPLLDVLFVLVVLFILIAPLLQIDRVNLLKTVEKPKTLKTANYKTHSPIVIEIDAENYLYINQKRCPLEDIYKSVSSMKMDTSITPLLLIDQKASFGNYERVKLILESLNFKQVDIALKS